jgi:hypothetical protein
VKLSGCASKPITRSTCFDSSFILFLTVRQTDGNGAGADRHSGMRGGPQVGALRRCSFTKTESDA